MHIVTFEKVKSDHDRLRDDSIEGWCTELPTDRTTNAARAYLRDHGFKEMKTKSCVVGGDL